MKYLFIILFFSFTCKSVNAHKQHVHQYITKEAYFQLRDFLGYDIPEMLAHLDNGSVGDSWTNGTLLAGVWLEDEYDAVYQYDNNDIASWIPDAIRNAFKIDKTYVSITHFWDADRGNFTQNMFIFNIPWLGSPDDGPFPNSYTKANYYYNGNYLLKIKRYPYIRVNTEDDDSGHWLQFWSVPFYGFEAAGFIYYSLADLYKNKRLSTKFGLYPLNRVYDETNKKWVSYYGDVYISEELREQIVWEILGRIAHLLQDLSVPTHAHIDEHGIDPDPYEEWIANSYSDRYQYYNHNNIENGIINPSEFSNPLHFLMYTTNKFQTILVQGVHMRAKVITLLQGIERLRSTII